MVKTGMTPQKAKEIREKKGIQDTNLQKMRVKKGLSQKELAVISDIPIRTIQHYEQQVRPIDNVTLERLCSIAIALDCKIEDILEDTKLIERYKLVK